MGRVTVYIRQQCPFCDKVQVLLSQRVAQAVECEQEVDATRPKSIHEPPPKPVLEILFLDVGRDAALAAQCIRLTNKRTVPQVFVNDKFIGNFRQTSKLDSTGALLEELRQASRSSTSFPPEAEAAMVKVTNELAFSSLPTIAQIKGLKAFGFRSLVNLCHPSQVSDGRLDAEAEAVASLGIAYTHLAPPGAEVPAAEPQQLPCETATDDGAASGAGAGAGAGTGTPTGDLAPSPLTRTSSYVRHTQDGTLLLRPFTYDLAWVRSALCSIFRAEKPVLVHDLTGVAACGVVLLRAALQMGADEAQVTRWGRDLGHDLPKHDELFRAVVAALEEAQKHGCVDSQNSRCCGRIAEVSDEEDEDDGAGEGKQQAGDGAAVAAS